MKRILLLLFSLITTAAIGQYPINQILSSDSTMVSVGRNATGGIRGGLVNMVFADTTAANLSRISYYTGAQIWTTTDSAIWVRFKGTPSFWVKMAGASGGTTGSFWNITGNYFGGGVPLNYGVGTNSYDYLPLKTNNITRLLIPPDGILRSSAPANKYLMMDTTTLEMYYGGEVATPTWQQTLTAGSTLAGGNTITTTSSALNIVGLTNLSTQDQIVGQRNSTGQLGYLTLGSGLSLSSGVLNTSGTVGGYYSYPINIDSLGAVGDGSTDNATVFNTARQLSLSTGRPILVPSGTYYTSDSIILNKQTIFGYGANSIIKVTSATVTSIYLQDSCTVFGIKFIGTGAGAVPGGVLTTQNGIRVHGGYNNIYSCFFSSITGSGIGIWETAAATIYQNRATNNKFIQCTIGIGSLINEEYSIYANNDISYCTVGIWDRSGGNTRWVDNTVSYCTVDGYRLTGGGNGDHSVVVGCTFNHNATNINIESTNLGQLFTGCNIMSGTSKLIKFGSVGTANRVIVSECNLYDGDIVGTTASACVVRDCNILSGGAGVTHSGSGIVYVNNNGSSDAQYWKSDLNTVGADGKLIGTADNYDFTIKTNNTSRVNILKTGEIGIGTAGATGFKMFIVGTGNSASTYHSLYRNANGENILTILDDGTFGIGNSSTGTNTSRFYGNVGIGVSPSAAFHVLKTTEQLRVGYDASNYYKTTVGSTGGVTFDAVGSGSQFSFSDNVNVTGTGNVFYGRWKARVDSTTSSATPTINTDNVDLFKITALAAAITSMTTNLSGTPNDGDILELVITDNGTARAITWGASFVSTTVTLPSTTTLGVTLTVVLQYYKSSSYGNNKWHCVNYY